MSKAERKALNKVRRAMLGCHRRDFLVDEFDLSNPREAQGKAFDIASAYGAASMDRIVMDALGRALQGYADVKERADSERARQAQEKTA